MTVQVDLWIWRVDAGFAPALLRGLTEEEKARADRYRFAQDRDAFIAGRGRLRAILSGYVGQSANQLVLAQGAHGKPRLVDHEGLAFNFSDSGALACLAVASSSRQSETTMHLGVDIEQKKPRDYLKLAERYFSSAEQAALRAHEAPQQADAFFRGWTRKEAFLKAAGTGLSTRLDAFDTTIDGECPPQITRIDATYFPDIDPEVASWRLHAFEPAAGYAGALAAQTGGGDLAVTVRECA